MPRLSSYSFAAMLVVVSLISASTNLSVADAQSTTKPQCAPLHTLYKEWVSPCTKNGTAIPNADSDQAWVPCICKPGFYPLASASENCMLTGTTEQHMITPANLDSLCKTYANYVEAAKQTADPQLGPALASATSIAAAAPTVSTPPGDDGNGSTSAGSRVDASLLVKVSAALTASVVLATALVL
ncbi:hypothetical protein EMPS_02596 [Entomortierella parvispora]|uniref:Uncharacterized protein n=1 Tax=Entomortierella parvispora TaxID=205924 RepID=A0A9P3H5Q7_9FUNG|nr:hypothetical protein EMPS_02596 [Entomortierella parvispora]